MSLLMNSFQAVEKARGGRLSPFSDGDSESSPAETPLEKETLSPEVKKSGAVFLGMALCLTTFSPAPADASVWQGHPSMAQRILAAGQPSQAKLSWRWVAVAIFLLSAAVWWAIQIGLI